MNIVDRITYYLEYCGSMDCVTTVPYCNYINISTNGTCRIMNWLNGIATYEIEGATFK